MHFLPIAERELRAAARKPATYYARVYTCGPMLLLLAQMYFLRGGMQRSPQQLGATLFETLSWGAFAMAMFAGMGAMSDCISREKRDGTLGLLFLTDLTGFDVVMGKLAANSLAVICSVLAIVPLFAITSLLGGVTLEQVARVALALLNAIFFSLSACLLASALSWEARRAASAAFLILLTFVMLIPALAAGIGMYLKATGHPAVGELWIYVFLINPASAFLLLTNWRFGGSAWMFWASLIVPHLMAWGLLWLTSRILPRAWQDRPASVARLRWRERFRRWLQGNEATRKRYRQRLLDLNPVTWLASRDRLKPVYPWCFLGVVLATWVAGLVFLERDWLIMPIAIAVIILLHLVLRMWTASESTQCLGENLRSGALELVLSTSLTVESILQGQWLALRRQFFLPAAAVLVADVGLVVLAHVFDPSVKRRDLMESSLVTLAAMLVFAADMYAIGWVGMWQSMTAKELVKASGQAISRILLLPMVWFGFLWLVFGYFIAMIKWRIVPEVLSWLLWFAVGLWNSWYFLRSSRRKLRAEFRTVAMSRFVGEVEKTMWQKMREWRIFGGGRRH